MRTVIFDLDGTLVSSHEDVWACLELALAPFHTAFPATVREDNRVLFQPAGEILKLAFPGASLADCERYAQDVHHFYADECRFEKTRLYPGIRELLKRLRGAGDRLLVVTMKPEDSARAVLRAKGIDGFFENIFSLDSFPPEKLKKAEIFRRVKERYGLGEGNCVTVGDQLADAEAAKAAGLPAVGVGWGYGEWGEAVVENVEELGRVLGEDE